MHERQQPHVEAATSTIRSWLSAHVEAATLHAAVDLHLLQPLLRAACQPQDLAASHGYDVGAVQVLLQALDGLGIVTRRADARYEIAGAHRAAFDPASPAFVGPAVTAAQGSWNRVRDGGPSAYGALIAASDLARRQAHPASAGLVARAWSHVGSGALGDLARYGLLRLLDERPRSREELAGQAGVPVVELAPLLAAARETGVLIDHGARIEMTDEARRAFGKGTVQGYDRWIEQRMEMERTYFWDPLGNLATCVRRGHPASLTSRVGASNPFRGIFTRINRPLIPTLSRVAHAVSQQVGAARRPLRILELGASLGCWGMALASCQAGSRVVAVDVPEALAETRHIVAAAGLDDRYIWRPGNPLECTYDRGQFDVVVLNEICHTVPPAALAGWVASVVQSLAPDGLVVLADMILDDEPTGPLRHLLAGVKLLVTGGGHLLSADGYGRLLQRAGLPDIRLYRLGTTDLMLARAPGHPA